MSDLRGKIADLLADERNVPTTVAAMDVVMAVIDAIDDTDETFTGSTVPGLRRYASNAKHAINALVDNTPVTR